MDKRGRIAGVFFEISLLICVSFAIAFIWNAGMGSAAAPAAGGTTPTPLGSSSITQQKLAGTGYYDALEAGGGAGSGASGAGAGTSAVAGKAGAGVLYDYVGGFWGTLAQGLFWGAVVGGVVYAIADAAGLDSGQSKAAGLSAGLGVTAGYYAYYGSWALGSSPTVAGGSFWGIATAFAWAIVAFVVVAAITYYFTSSKTTQYQYTFTCKPWKAPAGGDKCEECNNNPMMPCSEYRCRSLGQACELKNVGSDKETCVHVYPGDVVSPTITPWEDVLYPRDLKYTNVNIRPPSLGMKIVKGDNGCLPAFTPLQFGLVTNEPAYCKIDYNHTKSFDLMRYDFGESGYYEYNHTQKLLLPNAETNLTTQTPLSPYLKNDGTFALYVRCQDVNNNTNVDEFAVSFCVQKGPDVQQPIVVNTSIPSGGYVRYGAGTAEVSAFVNEPAECKWSTTSQDFSTMENKMSCATSPLQMNAAMTYTCTANFTGIKDREDNKYYIRCKDQPGKNESDRNVMTQSYPLTLKGSQPLNIMTVEPNSTISGNTETIKTVLKVTTDDGAQEGGAICAFSSTGNEGSYIIMAETGFDKFEHTQELNLPAGNYKYYFRCADAGGNTKEASVSFGVVVDKESPDVTRAYRENGLKIITNEDAECVYSFSSCNYVFKEGLPMTYSNPSVKTSSYAELKANSIYYVKCRDAYGNEPLPNKCSIVVSGV